MVRVRTGYGLWSQLVNRAGLDLRRYDATVATDLRRRLSLPLTGKLTTRIKDHKVGPEALLGAFFDALQPFTRMYSEILELIETIGFAEGKENLLVQFDFGLAEREFKLDLENFRKQVERWRKSIRPMTIDRWNTNRVWALVNTLGGTKWEYRHDPRIHEWAVPYDEGYWPEHDLEAPATENAELNDLLQRVWSVRSAMIEGARQVGSRRDALNSYDFERAELAIIDGQIGKTNEAIGTLRWLHSDHWAMSVTTGAYALADEVRANASFVGEQVKRLRDVLDNPPAERRDVEATISEIEELLSLPIWKHRYELYSIWVLTRIVDALGGAAKFRFMLEGGVFHIPFAAKRIAVMEGMEPVVSVWSEVRYPLANPRGKGRKGGMQPDYSLTIDTREPPEEAFALIECKQYLREARRSFGNALTDYATGQPKAQVVLVNGVVA